MDKYFQLYRHTVNFNYTFLDLLLGKKEKVKVPNSNFSVIRLASSLHGISHR